MNDFEVFLDQLIEEQIVRLAYHATEVQTRIDSFIVLQSRVLTGEEIELLITSESSTVKAEIDAMKRLIRRVARDVVTESAQSALLDYQERNNSADQLYTWAVESGNPCPDCSQRSQQGAFTMAYWRSVGLPKSGATICGKSCKCVLQKT